MFSKMLGKQFIVLYRLFLKNQLKKALVSPSQIGERASCRPALSQMMVGVDGPSMNMAALLHICSFLFLTFTHKDKSTLLSGAC